MCACKCVHVLSLRALTPLPGDVQVCRDAHQRDSGSRVPRTPRACPSMCGGVNEEACQTVKFTSRLYLCDVMMQATLALQRAQCALERAQCALQRAHGAAEVSNQGDCQGGSGGGLHRHCGEPRERMRERERERERERKKERKGTRVGERTVICCLWMHTR
jgi:hypothetical protein